MARQRLCNAILITCVACCAAVTLVLFSSLISGGSNAIQVFQRTTGYKIPATAKILFSNISPPTFHGDTISYVICDVDSQTLSGWLAGRPPWGGRWREGPVDPGIPEFLYPELRTYGIPSDRRILYSARDRSKKYHNGDLLAIDPFRSRIWFVSWDF